MCSPYGPPSLDRRRLLLFDESGSLRTRWLALLAETR